MTGNEKESKLDQLDPIRNIRKERVSFGMRRYGRNLLQLVFNEKHPYILHELLKLAGSLRNPFPYRDTRKIHNDFSFDFSDEDCINGDLNTYWMNINASAINIVRGKSHEIYIRKIELLNQSFFDYFNQYKFLEGHIYKYPFFYKEYLSHEKARMIILYYLFLEKRY